MKTIVIAGGSGFLGDILENYFTYKNYEVYILTRHPKKQNHHYWNGKDLGNWVKIFEKIDIIINLSGKSVDCRYHKKNKAAIYNSRIDATHAIGLAINLCQNPPKLWLNASTATIYRDSYDIEMTENKGIIGDDFSMNVAKCWEETFYTIVNPYTRKIALRTAIVFGKNGGAYRPLRRLAKFGLGGKQGLGNQKVSWIHEIDFARAVEFLILNTSLKGNFNICNPKPIDNKTLMKALRTSLNIPFGIPQPKHILAFGARIIQTETELVLKSRNVIPERLIKNGFKFEFNSIKSALKNLSK